MASDIPPLAELGDVTAYVCGSAGFCNAAGDLLVAPGPAGGADPHGALRPHGMSPAPA